MDGDLPRKAQRMQDSAAELGVSITSRRGRHYGLQALGDPCTNYGQGTLGLDLYATNISNGSRPPLDPFDSLAKPNTGCEYGDPQFQNAVHGFGSPNAGYDYGLRYPLNDIHGSSVAYGHGHHAAQFGGAPANEHLSAFGTAIAPIAVSGPGNNAAYDWLNGALSSSGSLAAPIVDYGVENYASEGTYSGLHPISNTGATGAVYGQADASGLAAFTGNVNTGLRDADTILAPNVVYNQDNYAGMDPYAGNFDQVLFSSNGMAASSAIRPRSGNATYSSNTANIRNGLLPIDNLAALNPAYDGASAGPQNANFGPHISGPTLAVGNSLSPSNTSGSGTGPPSRPRHTSVDRPGRPRWACGSCDKTFGRPSDMRRHAKKHSDVLRYQYQCGVVGCTYPGSYRPDKVEQHRKNCH